MKSNSIVNDKLNLQLREKYNPDGSQLRKAQLRMLEMMIFFKKICTDHNLTFWLDSGTLLGAVRHGGFIPWDDDVDVCMPYKDALKLREIMSQQNLSDEFVLQYHESDSGYYAFWDVFRDLKTEYLQDSNLHNIRKYRGLQIDIFPLDNHTVYIFHLLGRCFSRTIDLLLLAKKCRKINRVIAVFIFNGFKWLLLPLMNFITRAFFKPKQYMRPTYGSLIKYHFNTSDIYPLSNVEFEGHTFPSPGNVDGYLTSIYGNWREIPSEENIVTHNVHVVFKK